MVWDVVVCYENWVGGCGVRLLCVEFVVEVGYVVVGLVILSDLFRGVCWLLVVGVVFEMFFLL